MKKLKYLPALCALMLSLAACQNEPPQQTTETAVRTDTTDTFETVNYRGESYVEIGTVRMNDLSAPIYQSSDFTKYLIPWRDNLHFSGPANLDLSQLQVQDVEAANWSVKYRGTELFHGDPREDGWALEMLDKLREDLSDIASINPKQLAKALELDGAEKRAAYLNGERGNGEPGILFSEELFSFFVGEDGTYVALTISELGSLQFRADEWAPRGQTSREVTFESGLTGERYASENGRWELIVPSDLPNDGTPGQRP